MKRIAFVFCFVTSLFLTAFAQNHPTGPPQFITFPIVTHVAPAGLDHGHFVFTEGSAFPSPLAPNLGLADFNAAPVGTAALSGSNETDVSDGSDSYEGETSAAGTGTALAGTSNHIYPGNCSTSASSNTFGDCAVMAYHSTDGTTFTKTTISRRLQSRERSTCACQPRRLLFTFRSLLIGVGENSCAISCPL